MRPRKSAKFCAACFLLCAIPATGASIFLRGKVVMQDGSAPNRSVTIERFCYGTGASVIAANTLKTGQYVYTAELDALYWDNCGLRASVRGFESTVVPISRLNTWSNPNLPDIILREHDKSLGEGNSLTNSNIYFASSPIPPNARQPWSNALQAMQKSNWTLAEGQFRIVVKEAPNLAEGWNYLGDVTQRENKSEDAAQAYENAVRINPKLMPARVGLLRVYLDLKKWPEIEAAAADLVGQKADVQHPEIDTYRAMARYNAGDLAGAESSVQEGIRLDTKHQMPQSELVLATILAARSDYDGARGHMQRYLELDPRAADAAEVRERMNNLGKAGTGGTTMPALPGMNTVVDSTGEAWVPGGMKALAKMANMPREPAYQTFYEEYCRSIGRELTVGTSQGIPRYAQALRAFLASATELIQLGEKRDEVTVIRISAADGEQRQRAVRVLGLLGWTLEETNGTVHVEPGYRPEDGLLQTVAAALGIDQIAMQESLQSGAEFQFEVESENARLVGGNVWTQIIRQDAAPPGGLAAVFATDTRIALTCAGLNAMNADTAAAIMAGLGLRNLAAKYGLTLYRYGDVFSIKDGRVEVPGGPAADPVWQKLAGANPRNPAQFFRALLEKDAGRLAAFYSTVARADMAHQQYFTRSTDRAERFYSWFHDSPEMKMGVSGHIPGAHTEFLRNLPLDSSGNVRFPGGQSAWFPDAELPLGNTLLDALIPMTRLEQKRGTQLDQKAAALLARNYGQWAALYPYFESLPGMGLEEYAALVSFSESVARRPPAERGAVLGEWYALVDLITRGAKAGSLDSAAAARAFLEASSDLSSDAHTAQALVLLRKLAGSEDPEDGVASNLLRLNAEGRARYDRVLELLHAPRMTEVQPGDVPVTLSALVYAASLDPGLLVLNEDPGLLSRHRYSSGSGPLFARAELHGSQDANGTHFSGGFAGFEEAAKSLMGGAKAAPRVPVVERAVPQIASGSDDASSADFRGDSKLVEVYTTVTDNRGRYIDNLKQSQFTLLDGKDSQRITAFESQTSDLSVALLIDTTGSMVDTIASLKRAAMKLIDSLRPGDSVAVYSFNDQVTELTPFTTDRGITKRAVMNARPYGNTAIYDAVARIGHELTGRIGKKVVIVFTDGRDTASMLTVNAAIERAKVAGVPVYTIAEGEATSSPELLGQLAAISSATGGVSFQVRDPDDMGPVFEKVAEDLAHGYLLYFQALSQDSHAWREIHVTVDGQKDLRIRAREGYYP
jgi:VWFA-related protein